MEGADPILKIKTAPVFEPLLKPARYKDAWGGRGSGKNHFFAGLVVGDTARRNASFNHARRYAVIAGQLFRGLVAQGGLA
jgi:hypothetical protein